MEKAKAKAAKFSTLVFLWEVAMILAYGFCTDYSANVQATAQHTGTEDGGVGFYYPLYQDVHIMIYVGFAFLMTFLVRYGWSSFGYTFLLSALACQWVMLCVAFFHAAYKNDWHSVQLDITSLIGGDFGAGAMLISFGAILGKVSSTQLLVMTFFEMIIYAMNEMVVLLKFEAIDMGGSMVIHMFGAYFGLTVSYMLGNPAEKKKAAPTMSKHSGTLAFIGTIFLWAFWPSFNGALAKGDQQHRVIINTVLSICSSCISTWYISRFFRGHSKFDYEDIANATLAGGVAVGSSADLVIKPWGAMVLGNVAGIISCMGYIFLTPILARMGIHDTCGVHNLHGMPGLLGGIAGAISAATAGDASYGQAIGHIFHARAPSNATEAALMGVAPGQDRSASGQGGYQGAAIMTSLAFAIGGGIITGWIMRQKIFDPVEEHFYDDEEEWETAHVVSEDGNELHAHGHGSEEKAHLPAAAAAPSVAVAAGQKALELAPVAAAAPAAAV